jgi:hypothetical protein
MSDVPSRELARRAGVSEGLDRRGFLCGSLALLVAPAALARAAELEQALQTSGLVYVSPLRSDGSESTCHGEVWFGWIDGAVVINTSKQTWKARALERGLDRARIWVGDHGRWKRLLGRNQAFRQAPSFEARAERLKDEATLERLLAIYDRKYPDEIGKWRDRMRDGHADGSRILIRYTPV